MGQKKLHVPIEKGAELLEFVEEEDEDTQNGYGIEGGSEDGWDWINEDGFTCIHDHDWEAATSLPL